MWHLIYFGLFFLVVLAWCQIVLYVMVAIVHKKYAIIQQEIIALAYVIAYYWFL